MANAFDPGRVGLWVNDPANLPDRLPAIAKFAGGTFTDVFLPATARRASMDLVRATVRPDGSKLKAQIWAVPQSSETAAVFAARVDRAIDLLAPGVVELDIERPDAELAGFLRSTVEEFRKLRPTFLARLNLEPFKAGFLPADLLSSDSFLYAAAQTYYGDMSRVSERELYDDALRALVPSAKFQLCYGAAGPVRLDGTRGITLPDVMYRGHFSGRRLAGGLVFSDDLWVEVGLSGLPATAQAAA